MIRESAEPSVPASDEVAAGKVPLDASAVEAIARLYREHHDSLRRFLRARLHSSQEAEEVAQEAYVRLLGLTDPNTLSFLHALLYRTAANLATDRLRQRMRRQRLDDLVLVEAEQTPSPEYASAAQQELALICRMLEELPETCRRAFVLVNFEELSLVEAAQRLGLHKRHVRRLVARAIEHCHRVMEESTTYHGGSE